MSVESELLELEQAGWAALATSGDRATAFYRDVLAESVLMLLPGGMLIDERDAAIESMGGEPWDEFEIAEDRVLPIGDDGAVVAYRVDARRGDFEYGALVNSTYVRSGDSWKLTVHQQTPIEQ